MEKIQKLMAFFFALTGAASVLLMAYARHANSNGSEYLTIAANLMIPHSLLAMFALTQTAKIGQFSCASAAMVLAGNLLFAFPLIAMGFGIIDKTPSAPFGGMSFALSWVVLGIGFLRAKP